MTVLRLREVAAIFCLLTVCSIRFCSAQEIQCPDDVEVTEDLGIAALCPSVDLVPDSEGWNIHVTTIDDGDAVADMDYLRISGAVLTLFKDSEVCIVLCIIDDDDYEGRENFSVVFTLVASGDSCTTQVEITDFEDLQATPPPLSVAHCSEEVYVFITEGGTLATPARVCMSFNGEMPEVNRTAIVTEDGEYLISTPQMMDSDGELCVEIEELPPDTTPEFNVTFYLMDPQVNVQCHVKITNETDGEEGESGLYIGVAVGGGVLCVLIIVTTITIAAICVRRKKQAREMQQEVVGTEYAGIDQTTQRKKAIDTKVNVAYETRGNLVRINDNTAYGVTSSHNEPY